jgi:hypothetical protein
VLMSLALDVYMRRDRTARESLQVGMAGLILFLLIDLWLLFSIPEPFRQTLEAAVRQGVLPGVGHQDLMAIRGQALLGYLVAGILGFAALAAMIHRLRSPERTMISFGILSLVVIGELLWFARIQVRTSDPINYFPKVAAFSELAKLPKGRVIGVECLPANLSQMAGFSDVRGYDAVDPHFMVRLLERASDPSVRGPSYARIQWMMPRLIAEETGTVRLAPILDMLNLRYAIMRQKPLVDWPVVAQSEGYWILENPNASPRAFVPEKAIGDSDNGALKKMEAPDFKPLEVAYLEESEQPISEASGKVSITTDLPAHVELEVEIDKEGIVVLADSWAPDWTVTVDGQDAKSLRVNTAVRGVRVPAGKHKVVWEYWPRLITRTLPWSLTAITLSFLWCLGLLFRGVPKMLSVSGSGNNTV